jgi:uncharacterized membrane protein
MDTEKIKKYFVTLAIVLAIDLVWLLIIMKSFYVKQLTGFSRPEVVPMWSAFLAWALIPLGVVLFVDQVAKNNKQTVIYGAAYGLILYGLYGFTNYAILANWTIFLLIVDVIWGTFLCSISSLLLKLISAKWQKNIYR